MSWLLSAQLENKSASTTYKERAAPYQKPTPLFLSVKTDTELRYVK